MSENVSTSHMCFDPISGSEIKQSSPPCLKSTDEDDRVADSSSGQQEIFCLGNLWPLPLHPMAQLGIICFRN